MNIVTRIKNNLVYAYHKRRMDISLVNMGFLLYDTSEEGQADFKKYGKQYWDSARICTEIPLH